MTNKRETEREREIHEQGRKDAGKVGRRRGGGEEKGRGREREREGERKEGRGWKKRNRSH